MIMPNKLTWQQFLSFSRQLLDISESILDGWRMEGIPNDQMVGTAFLIKRETRVIYQPPCFTQACNDQLSQDERLEYDGSHDKRLEDESAVTHPSTPTGERVISYEYHVLYSESYQAPVMYFNAWTTDGALLTLDDIWAQIPASYQEATRATKWQTITQHEHPVLGQPFFQVHPCRTEEILASVPSSCNPLVSWLSVVAPLVGCQFPFAYASSMSTSSKH